jgi:hypothetical protein
MTAGPGNIGTPVAPQHDPGPAGENGIAAAPGLAQAGYPQPEVSEDKASFMKRCVNWPVLMQQVGSVSRRQAICQIMFQSGPTLRG